MVRLFRIVGISLVLTVPLLHLGCPSAPDGIIALIVSPTALDFDAATTELSFQVRKNYTSKPMAPFSATASESWITVSPATGISTGPDDPVTVNVTIDRTLLNAGTNSGTVRIASEGASDQFVRVSAFRQLAANFTANELQPFEGDTVGFQDLSQISGGGSITGWLWDFGDGGTSDVQHPAHQYNAVGTYDVTLTAQTEDDSATLTKRNFITVRAKVAPKADFVAMDTVVPASSSVAFVDLSDPGTASITVQDWSFGDGSTATGPAPTHVYALPGTYTVTLRVVSAHGEDVEVKQNYITVEPVPPMADFESSERQPYVGTEVRFTDMSQEGHAAIVSWYWEFGDGETSTDQNPLHTYETAGSMTVSLTVTDEEGTHDTETKAAYIEVRGYPPSASFEVNRPWGVTVDEFEFTNTSDDGTGPTTYRWTLGDGAESALKNPKHTYADFGTYDVMLRVQNPFGESVARFDGLRVFETQALDRYVRKEDAGIATVPILEESQPFGGGRWDVVSLVSQQWRDSSEVTPHIWQHWLALAIPDEITNDTALLFISGGSMSQSPPAPVPELIDFALRSGSIVALLKMVPNQPTVFTGEGVPRSEDEIIAYTFDQYMNSHVMGQTDEEWPALLPMAKSAVRAMDAVQQYAGSLASPIEVKDFVVTGASKRGWTTWLTAATDARVVGIAPMVIDMLNLAPQMDWHYSALCGYSEEIHDYVDMGVIARLYTPEGVSLRKIVDPMMYLSRLAIPKLGLNGTADEFFVPDSAQFYYMDAADYGSMHLRYFPNGNHYLLEGYDATVRGMLPFYNAVVNNEVLPHLDWTITDSPHEATLDVVLDTAPLSAHLWTGTVGETSGVRDFRLGTVGDDVWQSTPLTSVDPDGTYYSATLSAPPAGWTGYFMSFEFPSATDGEPHVFTTEVRCVPSMPPCYPIPGGYGTLETVGEGTDQISVVRVGGTRFEMGFWYGFLLAQQIDAIWTTFSALADEFPPGTLEFAVSQLWKAEYFDTGAWEQELAGVAHGCDVAGYSDITVEVLKKILVIPDLSEYNCSLFAAWGAATADGEMYQLRNLDWSMDLGVQDYPVVAIYEPDDGIKHAVIGFAGMLGIAGGGMNDYGIAVSEIMGYFCDDEYLEGIPFPVLLRDVLYHDSTLSQALTRMESATRTNQYHYCVGDPNAADPKARLLFTSRDRFDQWVDNESVSGQHPCHPDVNPYHASLNDAVYWKNHNGRDNEIIYNALLARYGTLDGAGAIEVAQAAGVNSTVLSIVYHNSGDDFWVAYANGLDPAQNQGYVRIELNP